MTDSDQADARVGAGWFPDPAGALQMRYWDGSRWTEHTAAPNRNTSVRGQLPAIAIIAVALASIAWLLGFVSSNAVPAVGVLLLLSTVAAIVLGVVGIVRARRNGRGFTTSVVATVMAGLIVVSGLSVLIRA
ncbi:DUF2510 domain-containing protein [Microbacterium sp. CFBP 8794]|uniref:DUF2510 domain-containing protein n=1 Tax=Microbacterium sp. CFBP 8794 TaxID=2775269 RepID=UPI0017802DA3|nr:DUF2510 domain-containing protein [Microbacterium sp. CFBP 8794]